MTIKGIEIAPFAKPFAEQVLKEGHTAKCKLMYHKFHYFDDEEEGVSLAIAYGKLSGALLYYDGSLAMTNFIKMQTGWINEAIEKIEKAETGKNGLDS